MSDSTPEELAEKLWFPRYFDDPRSDGGIADGLGIDLYEAFPLDKRAELIETVRKNRLAIKEQGRQAFVEGDADGFLCSAPNTYAMQMVEGNVLPLLRRGIYEEALVHAITATRTNNRRWPLSVFRDLFRWADRARLLAAGDPLPGTGPFTLYRGVAGRSERDRRVRGISWTGTLAKAAWFADRGWGLTNPEVYRCVIEAKHVLAYVNDREEDEYIVLLPRSAMVERVALPLLDPKVAA
jgi:hypothetical protein